MSSRNRQPPSPTFFWQGPFILLPVLVLAGFGLFSLRQDKLLVRSEAQERARALAHSLAEEIWNGLTISRSSKLDLHPQFHIDAKGQLIFPAPVQASPQPHPYPDDTLDGNQRALWRSLLGWDPVPDSDRSRLSVAEAFLETQPPDDLAAAVHFRLGHWLSLQGRTEEASAHYQLILDRYPTAMGETGLPLAPLASLKRLELIIRQTSSAGLGSAGSFLLEQTCSNVVHAPSSLTPLLLEKVSSLVEGSNSNRVLRWRQEWARHELGRRLCQAAQDRWTKGTTNASGLFHSRPFGQISTPAIPALVWIELQNREAPSDETRWLVVQAASDETGTIFRCLPSSLVSSIVGGKPQESSSQDDTLPQSDRPGTPESRAEAGQTHEILHQASEGLPGYALATVEVAGRTWTIRPKTEEGYPSQNRSRRGQADFKLEDSEGKEMETLARAAFPGTDASGIGIGIHLAQPALLYAHQRQRTWRMGILIAGAALTALVGFLLAKRAFWQQQRLAEMKSNFVSSVSHELRAPIASVRLMAEGLDRGTVQEPARKREYYRFIVQECRRLSSMIENVLDFSRIEQGRKQYELEPTDLRRLVEDSVKLMAPAAADRSVELRLDMPSLDPSGGLVHPAMDGQCMQQALINLIDNAIKHSPVGGTVCVDCRVRRNAGFQPASPEAACLGNLQLDAQFIPMGDAGSVPTCRQDACVKTGDAGSVSTSRQDVWVAFSVRDHGPGIPPEDQEKIFERFYRRGSELRRETQGIGIGLTIVKHIVEAHRGHVRVESQAGQGSRFIIELPMTLQ